MKLANRAQLAPKLLANQAAHTCRAAEQRLPSVVGERSSTFSRGGCGHGSMIEAAITARNNAPTPISSEIIGVLPFAPEDVADADLPALRGFDAHTECPTLKFPRVYRMHRAHA
jgi:hypothetical protein